MYQKCPICQHTLEEHTACRNCGFDPNDHKNILKNISAHITLSREEKSLLAKIQKMIIEFIESDSKKETIEPINIHNLLIDAHKFMSLSNKMINYMGLSDSIIVYIIEESTYIEKIKDVKFLKKLEDNSRRIPTNVRREVWKRDGGKCVICGSRVNLEYDHIVPISKGGSNTVRNIELLCEKCNREKSNKIG